MSYRKKIFERIEWNVFSKGNLEKSFSSEAVIKMKMVGKEEIHTAEEGVGPVDALFTALFRGVKQVYPEADQIKLVDYHVSYPGHNGKGTAGEVRVTLKMARGLKMVNIPIVSANILEATFQGMVESFEKLL